MVDKSNSRKAQSVPPVEISMCGLRNIGDERQTCWINRKPQYKTNQTFSGETADMSPQMPYDPFSTGLLKKDPVIIPNSPIQLKMHNNLNLLLVEDEDLCSKEVKKMLSKIRSWCWHGMTDSIESSVEWLNKMGVPDSSLWYRTCRWQSLRFLSWLMCKMPRDILILHNMMNLVIEEKQKVK